VTALSLDDVIEESKRFGRTAFVATASPDGEPHTVPVACTWIDGVLYAFVLTNGKKIRNIRTNPRAFVHYPVSEDTNWDSLMVTCDASVVDTLDGRRALWDRMGYDLSAFEPGGVESGNHCFIAMRPTQATVLRFYGLKGREVWRA
jgi:nitroimidazol reductase NimA-like FMN-containing flavoprotein (pyridoxamine 5'-phosphate oxidase superfamily)